MVAKSPQIAREVIKAAGIIQHTVRALPWNTANLSWYDFSEDVDEFILNLYDYFDIEFIRCSSCEEDCPLSLAHRLDDNKWACEHCWDERMR